MDEELMQVLFRVLPFLAVILGLTVAVKRKKLSTADLYIQRPASYKRLLAWWVSFLAFIILTEVTLHHFGLLRVGTWEGSLLPSLLKITGIVVLAPIAEELFFRGVVLHKLRQWKLKKHAAIALQAVFFVALHSAAFEITLSSNIGKAQIFVDAVLFAYAMYDTRSVYTPMVMHATGNAVAVLEQFIL